MRSRFKREDGAAAVEFALIVGVLTMLIFGMIEYGIFFLQAQTLRAGARGGARQAAVGATKSQIDKAVVEKVSCWTCHQGKSKPAIMPDAGWGRGGFSLLPAGPPMPPARGGN